MKQQTLAIIKPDVTRRHLIGQVLAEIERYDFDVKAMKMLHLTREQAEGFYAEHKGKEFMTRLLDFMTSAPIVVLVLEADDVISRYRSAMGATDPAKREAGTIRDKFAVTLTENSVHGSDSEESAKREIAYFFTPNEIV